MTKRICIWSGPRNISTALMYSFAQRWDTAVVDEPFYAYYLANTDAHHYHPGAIDVLQEMSQDGDKVIRDVILADYDTPIIFFKMMIHHIKGLDWSFLTETQNVLLTRNPVDMLPSFAKVVPGLGLHDTGYDVHAQLYDHLKHVGQSPPVLDSKAVLMNPRYVLSQLCQQLDIPFDEGMLTWKAGPRPEDGSWAKYWYSQVHKSTGFQPYQPKQEPFPPQLNDLLAICQPYYNQVANMAIRPD